MADVPHRVPAAIYKAGMFDSLRVRDFRYLWFSNLAATFAMQMQMVARGWLIYDMTQSALALTWVMLSFLLPSFLFSLLGGVLADRLHKKPIMITSEILNAIATNILAAIIWRGEVTFWHFIYFGAFNGTVLAMSMPARTSGARVVGRDSMVDGVAERRIQPVAHPGSLAGVLIAVFAGNSNTSMRGVGIVYFVLAALYVVAVASTTRHYRGAPSSAARPPHSRMCTKASATCAMSRSSSA
jgi:MFS family permease